MAGDKPSGLDRMAMGFVEKLLDKYVGLNSTQLKGMVEGMLNGVAQATGDIAAIKQQLAEQRAILDRLLARSDTGQSLDQPRSNGVDHSHAGDASGGAGE